MDVAQSLTTGLLPGLIPGLGDVMKNADPKRRGAAIRQIGQLFAQGAPHFGAAHVAVFDEVLTGLVAHADPAARADLAAQMAPLANAPPELVKHLINDNSIAVCGPLLGRSPLIAEPTLIEIARMKDQPHLLAMSGRAMLTSGVTDVIVRRGDRDVVRRVAGNAGAAFSNAGYTGLIRRAGDDGALALAIGQRADLSDSNLKELLAGSVDIVRRRLLAGVSPTRRNAIGLSEPSVPVARGLRRDFVPAQKAILALHRANALDETALLGFAKQRDYEATVAGLAAAAGVRIEKIDELMNGERHDPIMVLGRAIGLEWSTVRALIALRPGDNRTMSHRAQEEARQNFERLLPATAQRVVEFWRIRQPEIAAS